MTNEKRCNTLMKLHQEVKYIPITAIRPNPYQPRKDFSKRALDELSQSIRSYGVIQPISVRQISEGSYELIAGERRLKASRIAELEEIPALIVEFRDRESAMIALIENLQREDLNFMEEAQGYYNLIDDHNFTQQELAKKIGKSQSTIANKIRLLKLPQDIQSLLVSEKLTERHGRALLKLPDDDLRREILNKTIEDNLNVNSTETLVEDILDDFTKEEEEEIEKPKQSIKSLINIRIYLNTLKKAFKAIRESGLEADYKEYDKDNHVEVVIKIPKK